MISRHKNWKAGWMVDLDGFHLFMRDDAVARKVYSISQGYVKRFTLDYTYMITSGVFKN